MFYSYGGPQLEAGAAEIRLGSGPAALLISSNVPAGAVLWDRRGCKCFVLQKVYIYMKRHQTKGPKNRKNPWFSETSKQVVGEQTANKSLNI